MTIRVEFTCTKVDGSTPITLDEWVATLTEARQTEFLAARDRQTSLNNELAAAGHVVAEDKNGRTYANAEVYQANNTHEAESHDPAWVSFWNEYLTANDIIFTQKVTEA